MKSFIFKGLVISWPHPAPRCLPREKRQFPNRMWFIRRQCLVSSGVLVTCCLISCSIVSPTVNSSETHSDTPQQTSSSQSEQVLKGSRPLAQLQGQILPVTAEVELGGQIIGLEVAQTREQQAIGLMHRERLADDRGMLFPFAIPRSARFWMKNVLIPLDMVFVYQGEIVAILHDVPPCAADPCPTYGPEQQIVDHVIELRGGRAADLGLQAGDRVQVRWLNESSETEN